MASPSIYPGQRITAAIEADSGNERAVDVNLYLRRYRSQDDQLVLKAGPCHRLEPGARKTFSWTVDGAGNEPIAEVGVAVHSDERTQGALYLDYLTWDGEPDITFARPDPPPDRRRREMAVPQMWRRAWVNGVDSYDFRWPESFRIVQNRGRGLLITGTREWHNYRVDSEITLHLCNSAGIAARVQGMRRYYALLLCRLEDGRGVARLVRALDGDTVLAEANYPWNYGEKHTFALQVEGDRLRGCIDNLDEPLFDVSDSKLSGGGIALVVEEGRVMSDEVTVRPT